MRAKKVKTVSFRISPVLLAEVRKAATKDQRSMSDWITLQLAQTLQARQSQEKAA